MIFLNAVYKTAACKTLTALWCCAIAGISWRHMFSELFFISICSGVPHVHDGRKEILAIVRDRHSVQPTDLRLWSLVQLQLPKRSWGLETQWTIVDKIPPLPVCPQIRVLWRSGWCHWSRFNTLVSYKHQMSVRQSVCLSICLLYICDRNLKSVTKDW